MKIVDNVKWETKIVAIVATRGISVGLRNIFQKKHVQKPV